MSFNFYLLRGFRILLFPFSLLYGLGVVVRNFLYNQKWLQSSSFNLPVVCIGNLSVGGTGKSPMAEMLIEWLRHDFKLATISRGYKRKTTGYLLANNQTTALEIGDEPMQFHIKFPDVAVAVGEERLEAVPQLLQDVPDTQVILLDDAFQHRAIKAGLNIILTDYHNPYWYDWFLPTGDLRDQKSSARRADIIVVTKCPDTLSVATKNGLLQKINPLPTQQVFFTTLVYDTPFHITTGQAYALHAQVEVLLVCGIANPAPLKVYLEEHTAEYHQLSFTDHYIFSIDDLRMMQQKFAAMEGNEKIILTTEKDAVRLLKFGSELNGLPLFVQPVKHQVLFHEEAHFKSRILSYVSTYSKKGK